jgi:hypothetical protein
MDVVFIVVYRQAVSFAAIIRGATTSFFLRRYHGFSTG